MGFPVGLTRYGAKEIAASVLVLGAAGAALGLLVDPWAAAGPGALLAFVLYFFRDPGRVPPEGPDVIVAPADGRVVDLEEVDEPDFIGGRAVRVGIFLSLFNVHINRAPLAGEVGHVKYRPGRFLAAFNRRASAENESNTVGLVTSYFGPDGSPLRAVVKQISGVIARRIVCACREADRLALGQRFGMIKFGSRTELYLPAGSAEIAVKVGDRVRAGRTLIGRVRTVGGRGEGASD